MMSSSNTKKEKLSKALDSNLSGAFIAQFRKIIHNLEENKYSLGEEVDKKLVNDLNELIEEAKYLDPQFLPYASITTIVYRAENTTDLSNYSSLMKVAMKKIIDESDTNNFKGMECVVKLIEHFDLATNQMNDLYRRQNDEIKQIESDIKNINPKIEHIKPEVEQIGSKVEQIRSGLDEQESKIESSKEQLDKIYTDFITILGIFSAFMFGIFGGFKGVVAAIDLFKNNHLIGKPLMMTSVIMMSLMIILYMFISWLGFIVGRPLKRKCYKCENKKHNKCEHIYMHLIFRHLGFAFGIVAMVAVFGAGLILAIIGI